MKDIDKLMDMCSMVSDPNKVLNCEATVFSVGGLARELGKLTNILSILADLDLKDSKLIKQTTDNIFSMIIMCLNATEKHK